ncbi:unnamed protein product [Lactuca saligna]|uniref:Uncharacterized protein n=1 Tax=Lactuca saligna TaxID=75948 RepID=A0AA35ZY08_LACSI|nr:unnamed protein product [Lactuca saligna]
MLLLIKFPESTSSSRGTLHVLLFRTSIACICDDQLQSNVPRLQYHLPSSSRHPDSPSSSTIHQDYTDATHLRAVHDNDYYVSPNQMHTDFQTDFQDPPQPPPQIDPNTPLTYEHYLNLQQSIDNLRLNV